METKDITAMVAKLAAHATEINLITSELRAIRTRNLPAGVQIMQTKSIELSRAAKRFLGVYELGERKEISVMVKDLYKLMCWRAEFVESKSRKAEIISKRHFIIHVLYYVYNYTLTEISKYYQFDHTTVFSVIRRVNGHIEANDPTITKYYGFFDKVCTPEVHRARQ